MNYEQQLKDSGYEGKLDLASLIRACGDKFHKLQQNDNHGTNFSAFEFRASNEWKEGERMYTSGSTPEESVANLLLRLKLNNL